MARPTDQEATAIEKIVCFSQIPRERGMPCRGGAVVLGGLARRCTRVGQEAEKDGELWAEVFIVVSTERNAQGRVRSPF